MGTAMTDQDARSQILNRFYEAYQQYGLHVIVTSAEIASDLELESSQTRRCFDYLSAKGLIRPMTLGGGYSPTVELVDEVEEGGGAGK